VRAANFEVKHPKVPNQTTTRAPNDGSVILAGAWILQVDGGARRCRTAGIAAAATSNMLATNTGASS
jgi:hypothetical protein